MRRPLCHRLATVALAALTGLAFAPSAQADETATAGAAGIQNSDLCARVGHAAGWRGQTLRTAIAIGLAESRCDPGATYTNPGGSRDRGLWQINSRWHPDVNDQCAYDAQCNANNAHRISRGGSNWRPWATYNSGRYRGHLGEAGAACGRTRLC